MPKFIFAYHGAPQFNSPEEGQAHMVAWRAWRGDLGDAVIDPGMPVGASKTVSAIGVSNDGGANPLSGITIVEAEDIDAAIEMAKPCRHVTAGGTIEVAQALDMEM